MYKHAIGFLELTSDGSSVFEIINARQFQEQNGSLFARNPNGRDCFRHIWGSPVNVLRWPLKRAADGQPKADAFSSAASGPPERTLGEAQL
jgi:hypothetical protein